MINIIIFIISSLIYLIKDFKTALVFYGIVLVHEIFHILGILITKEKFRKIEVSPFGISIKISHKISGLKEAFIAFMGPFSNILMVFAALLLKKYNIADNIKFFVIANLAILIVNLLPALPLDGGRFLKGILSVFFDKEFCFNLIVGLTFSVVMLLVFFSYVYLNLPLLLIAIFLLFNIRQEKQNFLIEEILYKYNID